MTMRCINVKMYQFSAVKLKSYKINTMIFSHYRSMFVIYFQKTQILLKYIHLKIQIGLKTDKMTSNN